MSDLERGASSSISTAARFASLRDEHYTSKKFSILEDPSYQHGINPTVNTEMNRGGGGFDPDSITRPAGNIAKDRCLDLCTRIKRLIESDVLSVPTATIAKSSLFHTRTTVRRFACEAYMWYEGRQQNACHNRDHCRWVPTGSRSCRQCV
jgi:hypothetical protein